MMPFRSRQVDGSDSADRALGIVAPPPSLTDVDAAAMAHSPSDNGSVGDRQSWQSARSDTTAALRSRYPGVTAHSHVVCDEQGRQRELDLWICPAPATAQPTAVCICIIEPGHHLETTTLDFAAEAYRRHVHFVIADWVPHPDVSDDANELAAAIAACLDGEAEVRTAELADDDLPVVVIGAGRLCSRVARAASLDYRVDAVICDGWLWDIAEQITDHQPLDDIIAALSPSIVAATRTTPTLIAPAATVRFNDAFLNSAIRLLRDAGATLDILASTDPVAGIFDWIASRTKRQRSGPLSESTDV